MFDYTSLNKTMDDDRWFGASADGIDLYLRGDESGPDPSSVELARVVVDALDEVRRRAIEMAASFSKDEGDWHITAIDICEDAQRQECDYLIDLYFDPRSGTHEYDNTRFSVGFGFHSSGPAAFRHQPRKLVITYQ